MGQGTDPQSSAFSSGGCFSSCVGGKSCGQHPWEPVIVAWLHLCEDTWSFHFCGSSYWSRARWEAGAGEEWSGFWFCLSMLILERWLRQTFQEWLALMYPVILHPSSGTWLGKDSIPRLASDRGNINGPSWLNKQLRKLGETGLYECQCHFQDCCTLWGVEWNLQGQVQFVSSEGESYFLSQPINSSSASDLIFYYRKPQKASVSKDNGV